MNLRSPALGAVFKAFVVAGAFAITSTVAATAIAALNPRDQGMAVDLSAKMAILYLPYPNGVIR